MIKFHLKRSRTASQSSSKEDAGEIRRYDITEILLLGTELNVNFSFEDTEALKKIYKETRFFNYGFLDSDLLEGFIQFMQTKGRVVKKVRLPSGAIIGDYTSPLGNRILLLQKPP